MGTLIKINRIMKGKIKAVGLMMLLLVIVFVSACKKESIVVAGKAKVRFVNAYLNSDPQEFYQDNLKLTPQAISYGEYSAYSEVNSGRSVFWSNGVVENKATSFIDALLYSDYGYTLLYYENKESKPSVAGYINEERATSAGKYRARFVNLSVMFNDKSLVIVGKDNVVINGGLNYGDNPIYSELPVGGEVKINIKDGSAVTILDQSKFQEGKSYLVWLDTSDGLEVEYHVVPQN